jgi:hypothetical protein
VSGGGGGGGSGEAVTVSPARRGGFNNWSDFFAAAGLSDYAAEYEVLFRANAIELDQIQDLSGDVLKELHMKMGHIMKIMKLVASLRG